MFKYFKFTLFSKNKLDIDPRPYILYCGKYSLLLIISKVSHGELSSNRHVEFENSTSSVASLETLSVADLSQVGGAAGAQPSLRES